MNEIGKRLRSVRNLLNKSQEELAQDLELTKQAVSNMETGKSAPSIATLNKLSIDYDINLNYVVSGIGDILISKQKNMQALRQTILNDVKKMLDSKGIC